MNKVNSIVEVPVNVNRNCIFKGFAKIPSQTSYDQPLRPPSIWKTRLEKFMYKVDTTVGRRRLLIYILIVLVIITVVGSAGTLFFSVRANKTTTKQTGTATATQANMTATAQAYPYPAYPSYLSGSGTLAFADSLSQAWESGPDCQFS